MLKTLISHLHAIAAILLALLGMLLVGDALYSVGMALWRRQDLIAAALDGIGAIVVGIAVVDVAGYLLDEEVDRERELRSSREARASLTKFLTIVTIAITLEALVAVFKSARDAIPDLIYPAALFSSAVLAVVGLGAHQWLSRASERLVPPDDRRAEMDAEKSPD
jgi:hypothetical protein